MKNGKIKCSIVRFGILNRFPSTCLICRKQAEIDRKKAEVRARLEAQAAGKKAKKGFMTPERKKKLRVRFIRKKRFGV